MQFDLLIKNGRIYDGSGLPSYMGDVAVCNGRITEVGRINGSAQRTINADGLAVSPGFIDFHTHLDAQLLWDPLATSSCWHGVTSVITFYDAGYGYATRFLGCWIRERQVMGLDEGVRKLTFMVASIFGLHDRGLIRPGMAGDLVIFDPSTIRECEPEMVNDLPAGEKRLIQRSVGVQTTVVNGEVLIDNGEHSGAFPGRILKNANGIGL